MSRTVDAASLDLREFLKAGDHIVLGQACGEPSTLIEALIAQGRDIDGLSAFIATSFSGAFTPETADSFALSSMGAIGALSFTGDTVGRPYWPRVPANKILAFGLCLRQASSTSTPLAATVT